MISLIDMTLMTFVQVDNIHNVDLMFKIKSYTRLGNRTTSNLSKGKNTKKRSTRQNQFLGKYPNLKYLSVYFCFVDGLMRRP